MPELIIQSGKFHGKRLMLPDREVFIGRDEDCHVRLSSSLVSRKHCSLTPTAEGLWVRDLSSQNGTLVNDAPVSGSVLLKAGDVLQVGATTFQVPLQMPTAAQGSGKLGKISDADIASWLSDDAINTESKSADTAVIRHADPGTTEVPIPRAAHSPAKPLETLRRTPRTVKEQAAEIIRRHWELVRMKEQNPS